MEERYQLKTAMEKRYQPAQDSYGGKVFASCGLLAQAFLAGRLPGYSSPPSLIEILREIGTLA